MNISGTLSGQLTVASQDDIDITGNLLYNNPTGTDVLGLIADNDVAVVHASGADVTDDLTIDAAIMSLNHSFYVQFWDTGGNTACSATHPCAIPGAHSLNINGVIAQKFRGPVGTFNGGPATLRPATTRTTPTTRGSVSSARHTSSASPTQSGGSSLVRRDIPKQVP